MYTKDEKAEIWLDSFRLDYEKKAALHELCAAPYGLVERFASLRGRAAEIAGEETAKAMEQSLSSAEYMRRLLARYAEKGITCVAFSGHDYPEELKQIPDPPLVLYCRGNAALLRERKFAIVGSRRTPPQIMRLTESFSEGLSEHFAIVTGIAEGGDTAAANGALAGGRVISVLAYGFDYVYPECSRALLAKIAEKGLLVTERLPDEKPRAYLFPVRNRIIAGLSEGVLVVSGGEKSGTKITAERAFEYGRDVFAFPYPIGSSAGAGCNALIKEYAKLTDNLVDITAAFGINLTETEQIALTEAEAAVYNIIREGETHLAQIAARSGLKAYELPAILTLLEMKKLVAPCGGNRYAAIK